MRKHRVVPVFPGEKGLWEIVLGRGCWQKREPVNLEEAAYLAEKVSLYNAIYVYFESICAFDVYVCASVGVCLCLLGDGGLYICVYLWKYDYIYIFIYYIFLFNFFYLFVGVMSVWVYVRDREGVKMLWCYLVPTDDLFIFFLF